MKATAEEAIRDLLGRKDLNLSLGSSERFEYEKIPFSIPALDKLTGGGVPRKRLTLIYGATNVGKSYLTSQIVTSAQSVGGLAAWIDTELSWDGRWMAKCGVDTEKVIVSQPTSGEEALEVCRAFLEAGVDIVVLDSVAGLVPSAVMDEQFGYNPMAWQARFVNSSLPKLLPHLKNGSALVLINQVRASLGPVALDNMPGGIGQTFFAHNLLQVRRNSWIDEKGPGNTKIRVGFEMEVRLRKTKVGGENWNSAIVPFKVDGGFDVLESFIREAIELGIINQAGAWYTYGTIKEQGMPNFKSTLLATEGAVDKLRNDVSS